MVSNLKLNFETNFVLDLISFHCRLRLLEPFPEKNPFFLLPASPTCLMHRQNFFESFFSFSHVKYFLNSCSNLSAILKQQWEKLCNDDVNRASVL